MRISDSISQARWRLRLARDSIVTTKQFTIFLAKPRGFCAGVVRAIEIVERALDRFGAPIYVRHEIVHNKHVVDSLRAKGAVFVETLDEVPEGAVTIFSAHGVAQAVVNEAHRRGLPVIDATCPLVSKVHKEGQNHARNEREVVLIGHEDHPEVEGTQGQIPGGVHLVSNVADVQTLKIRDPSRLAYVTQTTLSVDDTRDIISALKARFPAVVGPDVKDICYATQNRQQAVRKMAAAVELILVVGAPNSSNSNRLREIGTQVGIPSYLISDSTEIDPAWFAGTNRIGLTAGASAPERLVQEVIDHIRTLGEVSVREIEGAEETVRFKLPRELDAAAKQASA